VLVVVAFYFAGAALFVYCEEPFDCSAPIDARNLVPKGVPKAVLDDDGKLVEISDTKADEENRSLVAQQYSGRINWVFLMAVYLLLCIATFAAAGGSVFRTFRTWRGRSVAMLIVIGVPALSGVGLYLWEHPTVIFPFLEKTSNLASPLKLFLWLRQQTL
jgi:hypothetical protein